MEKETSLKKQSNNNLDEENCQSSVGEKGEF